MQKRNISIYITNVDLVQRNAQELLSLLEDMGCDYSMSVESEDDGVEEDVKSEGESWDILRDEHGHAILPEATILKAPKIVPVTVYPTNGDPVMQVGTAELLPDGTALVTLGNVPGVKEALFGEQVLALSIVSEGPATPAKRWPSGRL